MKERRTKEKANNLRTEEDRRSGTTRTLRRTIGHWIGRKSTNRRWRVRFTTGRIAGVGNSSVFSSVSVSHIVVVYLQCRWRNSKPQRVLREKEFVKKWKCCEEEEEENGYRCSFLSSFVSESNLTLGCFGLASEKFYY